MTPAINTAKKANIFYKIHKYTHVSSSKSYGTEAADKMGVPSERVFKTLIIMLHGKNLAVGVIPVSSTLNMKLFAKAAGVKKAEMASTSDVKRSTGYVLGGVSPLGQKNKLKTLIHTSAKLHSTVFISAGLRGLVIELKPTDLEKLTKGSISEICNREISTPV